MLAFGARVPDERAQRAEDPGPRSEFAKRPDWSSAKYGRFANHCWTPDHATALRAARSGERGSRIRSHLDQGHLGNRAAARAVAFRPLRLGAARRARTPLLLRAARFGQPLRFGRHPSVEIFAPELLRAVLVVHDDP